MTTPHAIVQFGLPGFTDGRSLITYDSWLAKSLFEEVEVTLKTDETSEATIRLHDPRFRVIDSFADATAKAFVRIYFGYTEHLFEPLFKGILADVGREGPKTTFTCYDSAFLMKLEKKAGHKSQKDDVAIIQELVTKTKLPWKKADGSDAYLRFSPPDPPLVLEPHKAIMQDEQSDWDFMKERAHDAGYHVFVRQDTVFLRRPAQYGVNVITITPPHDKEVLDNWDFTFHTPQDQDSKPKVVAHRRRGHAGKQAEGRSDESPGAELSHLKIKKDLPQPSKSKLTKRAQAQKELERVHAFEGHVECLFPADSPPPDVQDTVTVNGIGRLLSGKYLVNQACHVFEPGRLSMELDLYRDIA